MTEQEIRDGYQAFKSEKFASTLAAIAQNHGLETTALKIFVEGIISRMIFDGEKLIDLLAPLELSWKARTQKELRLMDELVPLFKKLAHGREISGLKAYE
jgi:type I restriction enzyme R subunit